MWCATECGVVMWMSLENGVTRRVTRFTLSLEVSVKRTLFVSTIVSTRLRLSLEVNVGFFV